MKRKVRIRKAQFGGAPAAEQQQSAQQQQPTDQDIVNAITGLMQNGFDSEAILQKLVDAGIDQGRVSLMLSSIEEHIQDEKSLQDPTTIEDQGELMDMQAEQDLLEQQAAEEEEYKQKLAEMYYSDDSAEADDTGMEDQFVQDTILQRRGGALPSKRTFVKNTLKTLKAQQGTEVQENKADSTDTGERTKQLTEFISGVQGTADEALMKKDADEIYNNLSSYMPEAQFGAAMRPGQARRFNRRVNRGIAQIPQPIMNNGFISPFSVITAPMLGGFSAGQYAMPASGSYEGGPRLANIDVRRTGLFGRPKEYTITFAQEAYNNPKLREDVIKQEEENRKVSQKDVAENVTADKKEEERESKFITFQPTSNSTSTTSNVKPKATATTKTTKQVVQNAVPTPSFADLYPHYVNPMNSLVNKDLVVPGGGGLTIPNRFQGTEPWRAPLEQRSSNVLQNFGIKQVGGFVDPNSPINKFVYGGNEEYALPEISGKLTDSPYFEEGGLYKAQKGYWQNGEWIEGVHPKDAQELKRNSTLPAPGVTWEEWDSMTPEQKVLALRQSEQGQYKQNMAYGYNSYSPYVFPGGYAKQQGLPYDPETGEVYYGDFGPGTMLNKIDVRKTRLSGMPKKYTMYYTDYFPDDAVPGYNSTDSKSKESNDSTESEPRDYNRLNLAMSRIARPFQNAFNSLKKEIPTQAYGGMYKAQTGVGLDPRFYPDFPTDAELENVTWDYPTEQKPVDEPIAFNDLLGMKKYVKEQVEKKGVDPSVFGDQQEMSKILADPKQRAVDVKQKMSGQEKRQYLDLFNAGANRVLGMVGERGDKERMRKMNERYLADNIYGSTGTYDKGTYDTNSGLFRPNEMGFTGVVKYGGHVKYEEGGETWMSEDDVRRFLEEGGELEFI